MADSKELTILKYQGETTIKIHDEWIDKRNSLLGETRLLKTIDNPKGFETGEILLKKITKTSNELEKMRKEFAKPFTDMAKKIKALSDNARKELESEKSRVKKMLVDFNRKVELQRQKEEQEKAEKLRKLKEQEEKENACPFDELIIEQEQPKTQQITRIMTSIKKVKKFEIINPDLIPKQFLIPDEKKIRKAINNGVTEIKGVKIWEEDTIQSR